jgi:hypothetical protein
VAKGHKNADALQIEVMILTCATDEPTKMDY